MTVSLPNFRCIWPRHPAPGMSCREQMEYANSDGPDQAWANAADCGWLYYLQDAQGRIWLLTVYAKSARENIAVATLNMLREMADHAEID